MFHRYPTLMEVSGEIQKFLEKKGKQPTQVEMGPTKRENLKSELKQYRLDVLHQFNWESARLATPSDESVIFGCKIQNVNQEIIKVRE